MAGYIGNIPVPQATQTRDVFTATSGQTSFATSGYTPGFLDVFLNGVKLVGGTDFTASNGSDVVLSSGATAGDNIEVVAYTTFQTGDFVPTSGGTFTGAIDVSTVGTAGVTNASVKARRGGDAFEFGHPNTAGYGGTLGAETNSGANYLAFHAEQGTNINTYRTRGNRGSILRADTNGGMGFYNVADANADNQTATPRFFMNNIGLITVGKTPSVSRVWSAAVSTTGARVVCGFGNTVLDNIGSSTFGSYGIRPQLSGQYFLFAQLVAGGSAPGAFTPVLHIIKNGTTVYNQSDLINYVGGHSLAICAGIIATANGSSDYFEVGFSHNSGASYSVNTGGFTLFRLGDL